jgi:hypothetical protein
MNTQQQAYINGFVKRASEYGFKEREALNILKQASPETLTMSPGAVTAAQAANRPVRPVAPAPPPGVSAISPAMSKKLNIPLPPANPGVATQPTIDQKITRALGLSNSNTEYAPMKSTAYNNVLGR